LKLLKRLLFGRKRALGIGRSQPLLGVAHLCCGNRKHLGDLREIRIRLRDAALNEPLAKRANLLAKLLLRQLEGGHVLGQLLGRVCGPIAHHLVGAGDDFSLLARQRLRRIILGLLTGPATTTLGRRRRGTALTAFLLGLAIVAAIRTNFHEVDIGCRGLRCGCAIVVRGARVVRDEVARLESELLEQEGVSG
jgi:hypothetical protein